ncbi:TPA: hypothetical protein N0F65_000581 [Lagenidium giganteum]|uniref:AAA+ ATPase domain-containing protein n=1 Tax=Lagenidium giganteum TaxID=4803 RepID=A0AAV2YF87_9STRA|nr:TPA: hypothetical protein N0F65_000581 [Lagenidium giganteum]
MEPVAGHLLHCHCRTSVIARSQLATLHPPHTATAPTAMDAFFSHDPLTCDASSNTPDAPLGARTSALLFVHGPATCGKTSILLQYGFTRAKADARVVLVLCGDPNAATKPALAIARLAPCARCGLPRKTGKDNHVWQRIQIKYLRSHVELQHFACSLQLLPSQPQVLLIDGFERFFADSPTMGPVYQTLAYLFETLRYINQSTGTGEVVLSGNTDAFLLCERLCLRRWCRFVCIQPCQAAPGGSSDQFEITVEKFPDPEEDDDDDDDDEEEHENSDLKRVLVYEFSSPDAQRDGIFRLVNAG